MIYLDANLVVISYSDTTSTGDAVRKFFASAEDQLVASPLTIDEAVYKLSKILGEESAIMHCKHLLDGRNLKILPIDEYCTRRMLENMKEHNLDPRDALHLACMQVNNITQIATLDADFDKIRGIKRVKLLG